ncbi:MAG: hypothetical protein ACREFD_02040 [Stellaceae bacterium]
MSNPTDPNCKAGSVGPIGRAPIMAALQTMRGMPPVDAATPIAEPAAERNPPRNRRT